MAPEWSNLDSLVLVEAMRRHGCARSAAAAAQKWAAAYTDFPDAAACAARLAALGADGPGLDAALASLRGKRMCELRAAVALLDAQAAERAREPNTTANAASAGSAENAAAVGDERAPAAAPATVGTAVTEDGDPEATQTPPAKRTRFAGAAQEKQPAERNTNAESTRRDAAAPPAEPTEPTPRVREHRAGAAAPMPIPTPRARSAPREASRAPVGRTAPLEEATDANANKENVPPCQFEVRGMSSQWRRACKLPPYCNACASHRAWERWLRSGKNGRVASRGLQLALILLILTASILLRCWQVGDSVLAYHGPVIYSARVLKVKMRPVKGARKDAPQEWHCMLHWQVRTNVWRAG